MKLLKLTFLAAVTVVFLNTGCSKSTPGVWKNEKINKDQREEFHTYNAQLFKYIKEDDEKHLGYMMSKEFAEDYDLKRLLEHISYALQKTDFKIYDEYYVVKKSKSADIVGKNRRAAKKNNTNDTIYNKARGINNYSLYYDSTAPEMYVALFTAVKGDDKNMITVVYSKLDYGWKLTELEMGQYNAEGKTAPALYLAAQERLKKGYLIDAVNTMQLSNLCIRPSNLLKYEKDDEMGGFFQGIMATANAKYTYPIAIDKVPSHPSILRIFNDKTADGYIPTIYYLSSIKLDDTTALKAENEKVKKAIGEILPGIDKDKKQLAYSVFNKAPNAKTYVSHYDITEKLK